MAAGHESLRLGYRADAAALERLVAPGCHEFGAPRGENGERTGAKDRPVPTRCLLVPAWPRHYRAWGVHPCELAGNWRWSRLPGVTVDLVRYREPIAAGEAGMAQKITVALEDDLDGGPADETVRSGIGGAEYEIDLSKKNAPALRRRLDHARKAGRGPRRRTGRSAASRERSGDIGAWAKTHGITVSDRGRIPTSVVEQYEAGH